MTYYLMQKEPLHVFTVHSEAGLKAYLSMGCVRISKSRYEKIKAKS